MSNGTPRTDSAKCSSALKFNQYMVCDGPTCKSKETFIFAEVVREGSEGQKIRYAGLPLSNKRGMVRSIGGIQYFS